MPVDYSKWDALELSDDSDIEVHPNVDKRSFIRAKQNQIHMERQQRRLEIETLKYERQINDALARRIDSLLDVLRAHADEARDKNSDDPNAAGAVAFRAVMESAAQIKPEDDRPPKPPAGVQSEPGQPDSYTKMMASLLDQVNRALSDEERQKNKLPPLIGAARYDAMLDEIASHSRKIASLQQELQAKLAELENEEARKITSDSIHTGFNSSHVNKADSAAAESSSNRSSGQPELLNPNYHGSATDGILLPGQSSQASPDGDGHSGGEDDDDDTPMAASEVARQFASIPPSRLSDSEAFIRAHPELVASDRDSAGILLMAFDSEFEGQQDLTNRYVHQATLLEFCRALGRDGVALFFKRMMDVKGHQAQEVFRRDVKEKCDHIRKRTREINAQKAANEASGNGAPDGVEQIQLHAVEPGTVINIHIPPAGTQAELGPEFFRARQIFEGFQPEMKTALESGSLDRVNEVLGRMPVAEAEALVGEFSEAGILSMEDEIIDATTEEGRQQLKEMGRDEEGGSATEAAATAEAAQQQKEEKEEYPDPE